MSEYKPIHFNLFDPTKSLFKDHQNSKAEIQVISCCNSENCGLHKRGQCAYRASFGWHACPYGTYTKREGFTKRAQKFRSWMDEKREEYKGVPFLDSHSDMMAIVGEYVFLPYSHMDMCEDIPFLAHGGAFRKGNAFIKLEDFNLNTILTLVAFRPRALMGGEITDYQKKSVPSFIKHLMEVMPDLYEEAWEASDAIKKIAENNTDVGRKAKLRSINTNVGVLKDIHGGEWTWDGEWLICKNRKPSFMLVNKVDEIRIRPTGDPEITITDDGQVNADTEFLS